MHWLSTVMSLSWHISTMVPTSAHHSTSFWLHSNISCILSWNTSTVPGNFSDTSNKHYMSCKHSTINRDNILGSASLLFVHCFILSTIVGDHQWVKWDNRFPKCTSHVSSFEYNQVHCMPGLHLWAPWILSAVLHSWTGSDNIGSKSNALLGSLCAWFNSLKVVTDCMIDVFLERFKVWMAKVASMSAVS